ncbi:MBL fold metallo-hydrolase [Anaeromicropila herbilytica]|uniref:MBL fold metallo-hydrolase n=1 Tax=Anaeromicropila herbilytica TaxID=2785025 RepID=A0A7R7EIM7_9FIRM|nr:MBL fold metallo-hydrolase [Anaeromicropila herbilytica]BCN29472.1 MBL fold metallo-hydrolase [Anaeromicropila herbilytica]
MKRGLELIKEINEYKVEEGKLAFWWLGQIGYAIKMGKTIIYIDAYLSNNPERNIAPLLKPEEISNADIIIGTHDHEDHIDREVWHQLSISSPKAKFIVPELLLDSLSIDLEINKDRFIGLDDSQCIQVGEIKITGIAAAHEFLDQDAITGGYPYLGVVVEGNGCQFYHSGDSCIYEGLLTKLKGFPRLDVMFVPINGRDAKRYLGGFIGNMTYQEAVDLVGNLKPRLAVPAHYDMFTVNSENPGNFVDYLNAKYPGIASHVGDYGELVLI